MTLMMGDGVTIINGDVGLSSAKNLWITAEVGMMDAIRIFSDASLTSVIDVSNEYGYHETYNGFT